MTPEERYKKILAFGDYLRSGKHGRIHGNSKEWREYQKTLIDIFHKLKT